MFSCTKNNNKCAATDILYSQPLNLSTAESVKN